MGFVGLSRPEIVLETLDHMVYSTKKSQSCHLEGH